MIITCVHIYVKSENISDFIEATKKNQAGTIKESGNFRFDITQSTDEPSKFLLYEVFNSQADMDFHRTTAHYLTWRDTVATWMEKPREAVRYNAISPLNEKQWKYIW